MIAHQMRFALTGCMDAAKSSGCPAIDGAAAHGVPGEEAAGRHGVLLSRFLQAGPGMESTWHHARIKSKSSLP